jgi:subtilase family serine protease
MSPSGTNTATTSLTIPPDRAAGTYRIIVVADGGNVLTESNELNNVLATSAVKVVRADLTVPAVTAPVRASAGQRVVVTSAVRNASPAPARAAAATLYLADNDDRAGSLGITLARRGVPALRGLGVSTAATSVTIPAGTAVGTYFIKVVADCGGVVTEASEGNNVGVSRALRVGPDLTVTAATTVTAAVPGKTITVTSTVKNRGTAAVGAFTVGFYLSTDAVFAAGVDRLLTTRTVIGLPPAGLSVASTPVLIPPDTVPAAGYRILVRADEGGRLAEASETNNTRATAPITIVRADLTVPAVTAPVMAAAGQRVVVTSTVRNASPAPATAGASVAMLYLAGNDDPAGALGIALATRGVASLPGLGASTAATSVTIPAETAAGTYFIKVVADSEGTVGEASESNNVGVSPALLVAPM